MPPPLLLVWTAVQDTQGRVLLARRCGARVADGLWNLPGGAVEPGEDLRAAAVREVREEVGLELDAAQLSSLGVSSFDSFAGTANAAGEVGSAVRGAAFFFRARAWQGEPRPLDKTDAVQWADPAQLPSGCLPWLSSGEQGKQCSGLSCSERRGLRGGWVEEQQRSCRSCRHFGPA